MGGAALTPGLFADAGEDARPVNDVVRGAAMGRSGGGGQHLEQRFDVEGLLTPLQTRRSCRTLSCHGTQRATDESLTACARPLQGERERECDRDGEGGMGNRCRSGHLQVRASARYVRIMTLHVVAPEPGVER